jgi:hypothetical protein
VIRERRSPCVGLSLEHPGDDPVRLGGAIDDLSIFNDAQIVWSGDDAYSGNPNTAELIEAEDDVDTLESIAAGAEIWVKY